MKLTGINTIYCRCGVPEDEENAGVCIIPHSIAAVPMLSRTLRARSLVHGGLREARE